MIRLVGATLLGGQSKLQEVLGGIQADGYLLSSDWTLWRQARHCAVLNYSPYR